MLWFIYLHNAMKVSLRLLAALLPAIAGLVSGCAHDHHSDREFTPEELAELERKWGMEVMLLPFTLFFYVVDWNSVLMRVISGDSRA